MAWMTRSLLLAVLLLFDAMSARAAERAVSAASVVPVPEAPALSAPVALAGSIARRTVFGPPNYGETPERDARETVLVLRLETPICVTAKPDAPCPARNIVHEVQLVWTRALGPRPAEGICAAVTGRLFRAYSAHHHRPFLLVAMKVKRCGR